MVPASLSVRKAHSSRLLYNLVALVPQYVSQVFSPSNGPAIAKRASEFDPHNPKSILFAVLIPVLVLLSGVFAGLTLGYMSLDETQLNVLSISGTTKQREYANKIKPIRKNGHLLLVTLLLANMIVNESLPVIADPILGGGFQSVVVSTVLIVIFAEIIPQSLFTRHGLYLGAKMAGFTKVLIYVMGVIAWPVAKLLEFVLGSHHGIIYRRAELKELIAMHSSHATHGGDLKTDTVTIIGATLDLQEKVVKQAMTPISDVFMLSIDSKLDYDLLKKICQTGHSRIPVYEEVDIPMPASQNLGDKHIQRVKKIIGILLVKQCVLLDPKDATPLRKIPLNKVPFVPNNEPLLGILDKFQEGRSHMAIVSRFSVEKAASVKKAVKRGLTQRLRERVGMGDSDSSDESDEQDTARKYEKRRKSKHARAGRDVEEGTTDDGEATLKGDGVRMKDYGYDSTIVMTPRGRSQKKGTRERAPEATPEGVATPTVKSRRTSFQFPAGMTSMSMLEQSIPADAVLAKEDAAQFLQSFDPAVMPLGIITLEDVLEELIGEEIYDEFDPQGAHGDPYVPHAAHPTTAAPTDTPAPTVPEPHMPKPVSAHKPSALKGLDFLRSKSAPPSPRDGEDTPTGLPSAPVTTATTQLPVVSDPNLAAVPTTIQMPQPVVSRSESRTRLGDMSAMLMGGHMPLSGHPALVADARPAALPGHLAVSAGVHPVATAAPISRSASPVPSLEAILLDRKRRLMGATTAVPAVSAPTLTPAPPGMARSATVKGTKFKSSPLGVLDPDAYVYEDDGGDDGEKEKKEGGDEHDYSL